MGMVVNTNVSSLVAQSAANGTTKSLETAMERLSTGKRINSAADDAAGSAIASRMTSQIQGLGQAIRNAGDAQSLIDTTEGAHDEVVNILHRMRELAVQSSNDTNVAADRANLQLEVDQLLGEINRISSQTTWNGMNLLDGTFTSKSFQIGADSSQNVSLSVSDVSATQLGHYKIENVGGLQLDNAGLGSATVNPFTADTYTVNGPKGITTVAGLTTDSQKDMAAKFNAVTHLTGVSAKAVTNVLLTSKALSDTADTEAVPTTATTIDMDINGVSISQASITNTNFTDLRDKINAISAQTGVTAKIGSVNTDLILQDADGDTILIDNFDSSAATTVIGVAALKEDQSTQSGTSEATVTDKFAHVTTLSDPDRTSVADEDAVSIGGSLILSSSGAFTVTGGAAHTGDDATAQGHIQSTSSAGVLTTVSTTNLSTVAGSTTAIDAIDGALETIAERRATLGAVSNRMDNTISNLTNIKVNLEGSRSRIEDADFAAETANLTKSQILQQAATSMLAQANASKQSVLSLLQG